MDFIQLVMTNSVVGLREAPKHCPKANLHPKKSMVMIVTFVIWFTTAFWMPLKPLHLRSMLKKLDETHQNCTCCSWYWSTERAQFSIAVHEIMSYNQHFKLNELIDEGLPHAIFPWPLANWLPLLQVSQQLFAEKTLTTSRRPKMLSKSALTPKAWIFMLWE